VIGVTAETDGQAEFADIREYLGRSNSKRLNGTCVLLKAKAKARLRIDKLCVRETQQKAEQEESKTDAAISKSVNGPCDATEEDSLMNGGKRVTYYRQGSRNTQGLATEKHSTRR
jgi:ribonucleotide reductase alpha subunit